MAKTEGYLEMLLKIEFHTINANDKNIYICMDIGQINTLKFSTILSERHELLKNTNIFNIEFLFSGINFTIKHFFTRHCNIYLIMY